MLSGTDISSYQSSIPKGDFTILKATEGLTVNDSHFAAWWKKLEGKLRGAYHFAHTGNDPVAEADHFLRVVRAGGLKPGDILVLDHEARGASAAHDAAWAQTWCEHVHASVGYKPVVYTFLSFAQEGRCAGLGNYPLWMADPSRTPGNPRVPAPWSAWVLHQHSEAGGIDRDVFNGSAADWRLLGTPQEDNVALSADDIKKIWTTDGIVTAPDGNPKNPQWTPASHLTDLGKQTRAILAALGKVDGVDEDAIVRGVLTGLAPATIAAAVVAAMPADEAKKVVDELTARLAA